VFGALDPDTDTIYIYGDYKRSQAEPGIHAMAIKSKSKWEDAPCLIDPAGMGKSQTDGKQANALYRQHGLKLITAENSVEAGISVMWERMSTGRFKIFKSCRNLLQELITYRRNPKNEIIKENDHVVDPARYLCMGIKHARTKQMGSAQRFQNTRASGIKYF